MSWALDHLVVAARHLDDGIAWCEKTFGFTPVAGGRHPLMGTHNRVFAIGSASFPRAYFEIIAIDPDAPAPSRTRWFDLDDPVLQARIAQEPTLIHWVARCDALAPELAALQADGIVRGEALDAERPTPAGMLRWRIAVRPDGRRLAGGALPTLIEWGEVHPADGMSPSGVVLRRLTVRGLPPVVVARLPDGVDHAADADSPLEALFSTPRGPVTLRAPGHDDA